MTLKPGVYMATKLNGEIYYRSSITFQSKHISLGSFETEKSAHKAYVEASNILFHNRYSFDHYNKNKFELPFDKWVVLLNYRDNNMYIKTPIYMKHRYFIYYLSATELLKFDVDDLFYYSKHKIMKRGGHLFVSDYGMQVNILSRYGIKNFSVAGKDYRFANGDTTDYRYGNIQIINHYHGVSKLIKNGITTYETKIHINGNLLVGRYPSEVEAAIAYNKAATLLCSNGLDKNFPQNYVLELDEISYATLYNKVRISKKVRDYPARNEDHETTIG